jgi:hypothetical protein
VCHQARSFARSRDAAAGQQRRRGSYCPLRIIVDDAGMPSGSLVRIAIIPVAFAIFLLFAWALDIGNATPVRGDTRVAARRKQRRITVATSTAAVLLMTLLAGGLSLTAKAATRRSAGDSTTSGVQFQGIDPSTINGGNVDSQALQSQDQAPAVPQQQVIQPVSGTS